jgi:two-component system nitrogen regulation response regulator GlnG
MIEPRARILVVDPDPDVHYSFKRILEGKFGEVITVANGKQALREIDAHEPDIIVMEVQMPGLSGIETMRHLRAMNCRAPVIFTSSDGTAAQAINAIQKGAYDYLLKPFDVPRLKSLIEEALRASIDSKKIVVISQEQSPTETDAIIGRSPAMQAVVTAIGRVAPTNATVLITGESGTGKELIARAIYHHSQRAHERFLAVNCAAIPGNLLESELFGHEKGAFTGAAARRIGRFEKCHGGTLFLDEIGEMPLDLQSKLLRVIQQGQIERLGSTTPIKIDVRLVAATNRPLEDDVERGTFRQDLFYRLNVFRIHLSPLRQRPDDIPLLVDYFLERMRQKNMGKLESMTPDAIQFLQSCPWRGNVRELENFLQRLSISCPSRRVGLEQTRFLYEQGHNSPSVPFPEVPDSPRKPEPAALGSPQPASAGTEQPDIDSLSHALDLLFEAAQDHPELPLIPAAERFLIARALEITGGNQVQSARLLGITRATLRKRIEKYNINLQVKAQ